MPKKTIVGAEAKTATTLRLTDEMVGRADALAARLGITRAAVLRMSLMKGLTSLEGECGPAYVPPPESTPPAPRGGVEETEPNTAGKCVRAATGSRHGLHKGRRRRKR